MGGQLDVGCELDSLVGGFGGDRGGIRDDEGNDEFAFVADDHGVEDVGAGLERVFHGLRGDKFTCGSLQQIFLAVGDEKIVVLVQVADVAGGEPTILAENFACGFGVFVVAVHDARTLDEDFSIFGNADLDIGNRLAGTADTILRIVAGNDGRSFRQTITLVDRDTHGPEKFRERFRKRRSAGRDDAQMATGSEADFLIDQFVGELPLGFQGETCRGSGGAPGCGTMGHVHGPIKNHSLHTGVFRALLDEARVDFFKEPGYRGGNRGADLEESLCDGIDGFDIGKGSALKEIDVVARAAVNVGERKERERDVLGGVEAEVVANVGDVGAKIAVREHHAFRLAGGAGSVDERSELAGKNLRSARTVGGNVRCARAGDKSFVAEAIAGDIGATVGDNNLLQLGKAGADSEKLLQLGRADNEDDLGSAVFQDVRHAVGRFVEINGHGDGASAVDGEVGGMPLGAVGGKETDAVAGLHAEFHESGGKASDAAEKFLGPDGFPAAVAANHLGARVRKIIDGVQEA